MTVKNTSASALPIITSPSSSGTQDVLPTISSTGTEDILPSITSSNNVSINPLTTNTSEPDPTKIKPDPTKTKSFENVNVTVIPPVTHVTNVSDTPLSPSQGISTDEVAFSATDDPASGAEVASGDELLEDGMLDDLYSEVSYDVLAVDLDTFIEQKIIVANHTKYLCPLYNLTSFSVAWFDHVYFLTEKCALDPYGSSSVIFVNDTSIISLNPDLSVVLIDTIYKRLQVDVLVPTFLETLNSYRYKFLTWILS